MKIMIKSLAGGNFHLEAEPTDTIATIKNKIKDAQGHAPEQQKIIFSGKILTDDKTVQDCNIKEKDFLVVMVSKPKAPKPAAAAAASTSAAPAKEEAAPAKETSAPTPMAEDKPATAAAASETSAPASTEASSTAAPAAAAAPAQEPGAPGSSSSFISGSQLESAMQNMVEMGFERDQVQKAMRAAFNNPDRAVEYLMTGIPASAEPQQPPAAAPQQPASTEGEGEGAAPARPAAAAAPSTPSNPRAGNLFEAAAAQAQGGGRGGAGAGAGAGALGDLPGEDNGNGEQVIDLGNPAMLAQLQQLVQQNPAALQPLVQAIAQSNPQLAEALNQDPQGVLSLLAGGAGGGEEMDLPTMAELSEEDRTAVQQIVQMGIPESKAIESYFMCGKNVEMAVQYYFENPQDFDD
ncbi:related to RAD23 - nucleotide excision repair protein (ubiquitin-like protein) [Pseudozyma flocculosa]|uniref:UV excision repair protein RAD23 n=1 Tax=Pseudozyma flocculosa TaxID=84751 RepID=A0A5C3F3S1_9BASI|nr:related to RAD23 - nucleotide excision repair protein (ubiquitin-like protein) [Pseudozyma flocculosa]